MGGSSSVVTKPPPNLESTTSVNTGATKRRVEPSLIDSDDDDVSSSALTDNRPSSSPEWAHAGPVVVGDIESASRRMDDRDGTDDAVVESQTGGSPVDRSGPP